MKHEQAWIAPTALRRVVGRARLPRERGEDGFILLESIVALGMVTVLLGALASFTLNAVTATTDLRARQGAVQVASSTMATVTSVPATALLALPTTAASQVLNSVTYYPTIAVTQCALRSATTAATSASPSALAATDCITSGLGVTQLRVTVTVTWSGRGCRSGSCTYSTATLLNPTEDPVFNTNRANPPVTPVVSNPGAQVSTKGAVETLQLAVQSGTGLDPHTWQVVGLPAGLSWTTRGLITGTPTTVGGPTTVSLTVSDVFDRTATASFTWRVVEPPTITTPLTQSSSRGQAVSLTVARDCPNAPCTFTATALPAGLTIDAATGVISGTPTTAGTSAVVVSLADADGVRATTSSFTWTVIDPVSVGSPGTVNVTVGGTVSVPVAYTCTTGPCTITLAGTVPGVGLSRTTPSTANNTTTSLSVASGSGSVYLTGVVQASAVPSGTSRAWAPTLTIANGGSSASAAGAWTAYLRPTLGTVGNRNATVGATKNVSIDYTCSLAPCTLALTGSVPGLGLSATSGRTTANSTTSLTLTAASGTVWINGLVGAAAVPSGTSRAWTPTLTITDAGSAAATSTGTWTATTAPRISNPGSQAVAPNQNVALQLSADCPNGGCTWYAEVQVGNDPTWIQVPISGTGRISYNNVPAGSYTVRARVTDADGITDTVTFPLTVQTFTLAIPNLVSNRPSSGTRVLTFDVSPYMSPNVDGLIYTITGQPSWLTISADGVLTATLTSSSSTDNSISVTATSTASAASQVSDAFSWTIQ